ncbi:MAG TPA: hypothetical protein VGP72_23285 [Planctomycetota bacterium]|jgi:type VI protein secretion system component VasK
MPRKTYDTDTRAALLKAASQTRAEGKTWNEVLTAAKEAGYTGSRQGIRKMVLAAETKKGRKPGRPAGKRARRVARAKKIAPAVKGKGRGRRLYDEATKAAIIKAAKDARAAGAKWPEALKAARGAGYNGGMVSLMLFVRGSRKGPGRPRGRRGRPASAPASAQLGAIPQMIDRIVKEQVHAALDRAIAALEGMR